MIVLPCTLLLFSLFASALPVSAEGVPSGFQQQAKSPPGASPDRSQVSSGEDWKVPSIKGQNLSMRPVFVVQRDVKKDFKREIIRVQWRSGDVIELFVFTPKDVPKAPAILYLYSYPSDNNRFYDDEWAERVTSQGFAAVGFVSALTGQRYKYRPMKEWFVSELQESLGTSTHDVQMILNYLDARGDIDMKRIGMFGQGSGAAIAILAAQADPRIQALDLLNPWGDWPDWLRDSPQVPDDERPNFLKPEFLNKVTMLDPVTYLPHLPVRSLRIQEISPYMPKSVADKYKVSAPATDVFVYPDANAHYSAMRSSGVAGWLKQQLQASVPATQPPVTTSSYRTKSSPQPDSR